MDGDSALVKNGPAPEEQQMVGGLCWPVNHCHDLLIINRASNLS